MQARDVMTTQVATVGPDAAIETAIALMTQQRVSGVPVVDAEGRLVGILTEGDLLRRVEIGTDDHLRRPFLDLLMGRGREAVEYVRSHSRRVSDLMTEEIVSVDDDAPLREVVRLMEKRRVRRVPVLRNRRLVGVVSRHDLIVALGRELQEIEAPRPTDAALAAKIQGEILNAHWLGSSSVGITVEGGVVTLEGVIHDERVRAAIRVAAENVPGVKAVHDEIVFVEPQTGAISAGVM